MDAAAVDPRSTGGFVLDPRRWFILAYFCSVNANQCLGWFTFASLSVETMQEYFGPGMDKGTTDVLLNWGPWFGMIFFFPAMWISARPGGLRKALWWGILFCFFGHVIRMIPICMREWGGDVAATQTNFAFFCYHVGQILIASSGPFNMGAVTLISMVWFAEHERTMATAIAQVSNGFGATVGFLNPIYLSTNAAEIPNMFYLGLVISIIPVFCAGFYLPAKPRNYPSAAAAAELDSVGYCQELGQIRQLLTNGSFCILIAAVGIFSGGLAGWQGVFQSMLGPEGISENTVGWIGFFNGVVGNLAGILAGSLIDRVFKRRLKAGILLGLVGCLGCLVLFTLSLPSFGMKAPNSVLPHNSASLGLILGMCGFFTGSAMPLFYELAAELMYPAKESTSAGIIVFIMNGVAGAMIGLNTYLTAENMNYIILVIVVILVFAVTIGVREEYKRPTDEEKSQKRLVQVADSDAIGE